MMVNTKKTTPKEGCWITEEMQETTAGQEHERSKKHARAGGMVEQEKRQRKANCPEQGRSQKDTRVATERRRRKRDDAKAPRSVEEPTLEQLSRNHNALTPISCATHRIPGGAEFNLHSEATGEREGGEEMCPDGS